MAATRLLRNEILRGKTGAEIHNIFPVLYNNAASDLLKNMELAAAKTVRQMLRAISMGRFPCRFSKTQTVFHEFGEVITVGEIRVLFFPLRYPTMGTRYRRSWKPAEELILQCAAGMFLTYNAIQ